MATLKTIPISEIFVGQRIRPIDDEAALAIAASMAERGLINPITVRPTPAANGGKTPYTLVTGGHRLRAAELNQWHEIEANIVSMDAVEAQLTELSENIYRKELSKLDRAIFVVKYREIYEEKFGKINPAGGRPKKQGQNAHVIFAPGRQISERIQEELGFSEDKYKRATRIGLGIRPDLQAAIRGTTAENEQTLLLKLAKMPEAEQAGLVGAMKIEPDIHKAMEILRPEKPALSVSDRQDVIFEKVVKLLQDADEATLKRILDHIGDQRDLSFLEDAA